MRSSQRPLGGAVNPRRRRRRSLGSRASALVALGAVAVTAAACTDDDSTTASAPSRGAVTTTSVERATTTTTAARLDGKLVIGALLPRSGTGSTIGEPLMAGAELAVSQINQAGGVNGMPVRLEVRDEGADLDTAARSLESMTDARADVVVGPASSRVALGLLAQIIEPGLTACSPTATAISLGRFPDDGRFFRAIPSDALQAAALAELIEQTGSDEVSVVYIDDEFGLDFSAALDEELERRAMTLLSATAYASSDLDLSSVANEAMRSDPEAVAVIGNSSDGARMLSALQAADERDVRYFLNDPLRTSGFASSLDSGSGPFLKRVQGLSPWSEPGSDPFRAAYTSRFTGAPIDFAAYAYDCTMLLALAATASGSDDPAEIAQAMVSVSRNGSPCTTFEECSAFLAEGRNIDYVGASGPVDMDEEGDVLAGTFSVYGFDLGGQDVTVDKLTV